VSALTVEGVAVSATTRTTIGDSAVGVRRRAKSGVMRSHKLGDVRTGQIHTDFMSGDEATILRAILASPGPVLHGGTLLGADAYFHVSGVQQQPLGADLWVLSWRIEETALKSHLLFSFDADAPGAPTFTRTGVASYTDSDGVLQTAATGVARVGAFSDYVDLDGDGIFETPTGLFEPAASNLLLQSADFDTTWTPISSPTITTDAETAPNGVAEADNIEDTGAGVQGVRQDATIPDDSESYVFSVFVHKTAHSGDIGQFQVSLLNGTGVEGSIRFDPGAGTVAATPSSTPDDFGIEDYSADWWRIWVTRINNSSGNTNARCEFFPAAAATLGGAADSAQAGDATFWGAQLEVGAEPGSYIPTTTVAVTRAADLWFADFLHPPTSFAAGGGTLYAKWIERGTRAKAVAQASAAWVVCVGNTTPRWAIAYSAPGLLEGGFRNSSVLRSSSIDVSSALSIGDIVEAVVNLHPDGSVQTFAEITSGGVPGGLLTGPQSGAQPEGFVAAWQQDRVYLNTGLGGGANSSHGFAGFFFGKIVRGVYTMDQMRSFAAARLYQRIA
jgi:hypothetical protein